MKKQLLIITVFALIGLSAKSQITSTFPDGSTFVQGINGVYDTINVTGDLNTPSDSVIIYITDAAQTMVYDYSPTSSTIIGTQLVKDLGSYPAGSYTIFATYFLASNPTYSTPVGFTIIQKPEWLTETNSSANISGIDVTNNVITLDCTLGLIEKTKTISDSVKLLGGETFGLQNNFGFTAQYNYLTRASVVPLQTQDYYYTLIAMSSPIFSQHLNTTNLPAYTNNLISGLTFNTTLDNSFNLGFTADFLKTRNLLDKNTPNWKIPTPIPGIIIGLSAGIRIDGGIGGHINYGLDGTTSQYGFLNNGSGVSNLAIGGKITGTINGSLSLVSEYIANIRGTLIAKGSVGISYQFQTQPSGYLDSVKFGGDFQLSGTITTDNIARKVWRLITGQPQTARVLCEGNIWPENAPYVFGDGFPSALANMDIIYSNNLSKTFMSNWYFDIPVFGAQPSIATRGNDMAVVWMEADTSMQYLRFAKYDTASNCFIHEQVIVSNDSSISNPKISLLKSGDAIITWTQNRYDENSLPTGITLSQFYDAQDIYFAIYDNASNSIIYKGQLADNANVSISRAEGEATVAAGNGNNAIITWQSRAQGATNAEVYFCNVSKVGATWQATTPAPIFNLPGANYKVKVAYTDTINAVALWISDADAIDTTFNNNVMASFWTGSSWSTPTVFAPSAPYTRYDELDLDVNENFGAFALTYEYYDSVSNSFLNAVDVDLYNTTSGWITTGNQIISDSLSIFKLPRVSIDTNGLASVIFQKQLLVEDSITHDQGELMMFANDIPSSSGWIQVNNTNYINDTNTIVSFMTTGYTSNRNIFVITQESDTIVGNNYVPSDGVLFGDHSLGLVLRVAQIDNSLNSLINVSEPQCVPVGIHNGIASQLNSEILYQNYPNPATD